MREEQAKEWKVGEEEKKFHTEGTEDKEEKIVPKCDLKNIEIQCIKYLGKCDICILLCFIIQICGKSPSFLNILKAFIR